MRLSKSEVRSNKSMEFFEGFSQFVKEKYFLQIERDLENFDHGLELLQGNINAIRSQIEIEKAKSDRDFKELIAVVGTGVAVAGLTGDNAITECKSMFGDKFFLCQNTLLYKFILVLIACLLAWFVRKYILKRS
ncbi:hypothetical protein [Dapis sp. BLCC M229]|uniref:hypothetical protein n=1 Tax=Dapis sp. BLCC M229 TaxID=3400188 RepID=UPI003CE80087